MKNTRDNQIGYNRQVKLEWLDFTASLMAAGESQQYIKTALENYLQDQLSIGSDAIRGSRGKTISILLSIWVTVPKHLTELRDEALSLLRHLSVSEHLVLHWGMTMTTYPFFGIVADAAGRMLNLQGSLSSILLQNRMSEIYGQRETAIRSTRYVFYSFTQWGPLTETKEKGVYCLSEKKVLGNQQLQEWLIKAFLLNEGKKMTPLNAILRSPKLFPFQFNEPFFPDNQADLDLFRQGLDEIMISMK